MDASKKIFMATRIVLFDFELFIGVQRQKKELISFSSYQPF